MTSDAGPSLLLREREAVDRALREVTEGLLSGCDGPVAAAIRYALAGSGKRVRGALVMAAYRAAGGRGNAASLAAAVEIVHAYSLIHDDLPCMDDDDVRRGRPTVHRAFDVRVATIAGLAMVPLAVRVAQQAAQALQPDPCLVAGIVRELMDASGAEGMVGGQWLDLAGAGGTHSREALEHLHRMKTGALLRASARIGAMAAGAGPAMIAAMARFGADVGLAFQIVDDVLDVTSTSAVLGKTAGSDASHGKQTYPALHGVSAASRQAREHVAAARAELAAHGALTDELDALARYAVERSA